MLLLTTATACLITGILAQLPPSYTLAHTNITLGVKYGSINMTAGSTLDFNVPSQAPILSTPVASNGTYIAIAVDTTANLSSTIPAELLWFQQDLAFSPAGIASSRSIAQVPYLVPANVGHGYLILLYAQPPGFIIPPDFPYTGKFRSNFNVSRVAVDFKAPPLEANWFILGSNCTKEEATPTGTSTVGTAYATGTAGYYGRNGPFPRSGFHLRD